MSLTAAVAVHYPGDGRPGSTACGYGLTGPEPDYRISADRRDVTCGRCKLSMTYRTGAESRDDLAVKAADLFTRWAKHDGLLAVITEEQCADLAKAFIAGYLTGRPDLPMPWEL